MMLNCYDSALTNMQSHYNAALGQKQLLEQQLQGKQDNLDQTRQNLTTWEQVQVLFTKVSEYAREQLKARIEETVTAALTAVFGEGYTFRINMRQLGNQPAAEWQVVSQYGDTEVAASPEDARGGGITDVVSLALRLAMLEILKPRPEGPVIFDEPAKMVSAEYAGNLAYFLKQYAEKTERQVVMVTHNPQLAEAADKSYLVTQKDGVSEVREIG
jgi:DNA repair exonuclease SbcCD ATPase subunit